MGAEAPERNVLVALGIAYTELPAYNAVVPTRAT